jgi:carbon-monoxide dehydrogenase large subunit
MAHATDPDTYVGRPMKRREDRRLLLGAGTFVDDLRPAGCLSVVLVRSPHGHARIARLDARPKATLQLLDAEQVEAHHLLLVIASRSGST